MIEKKVTIFDEGRNGQTREAATCARCGQPERWAVFQLEGAWYCCDCWPAVQSRHLAPWAIGEVGR